MGVDRVSSAKQVKLASTKEYLSVLPDDLLSSVIALLDVRELASVQICDRRLLRLAGNDTLWADRFMRRFGKPNKILLAARQLAGSWQNLYKSKVETDKAAGQWRKPSPFELQAALQAMLTDNTSTSSTSITTSTSSSSSKEASETSAGSGAVPDELAEATAASDMESEEDQVTSSSSSSGESVIINNSNELTQLAVVFLIDSSGSVGDEDFTCMTDFLDTAAQAVAETPRCKVCVIQFSNDTRVEVPLGRLDKPGFDAAVKNMVRLNGGTNIAAAVAKAGALLKADEADCSPDMKRVLVLLTDGRIDSYQAREAAQMVGRLADEQSNVAMWAFGVGRGVDAAELMRIIEGPGGDTNKGLGRERYMDLCVRDDAPW